MYNTPSPPKCLLFSIYNNTYFLPSSTPFLKPGNHQYVIYFYTFCQFCNLYNGTFGNSSSLPPSPSLSSPTLLLPPLFLCFLFYLYAMPSYELGWPSLIIHRQRLFSHRLPSLGIGFIHSVYFSGESSRILYISILCSFSLLNSSLWVWVYCYLTMHPFEGIWTISSCILLLLKKVFQHLHTLAVWYTVCFAQSLMPRK